MRRVILSLLAKEHVLSVISLTDIEYRDLHAIEIRYTKNTKCYSAKSFYTATWASASPLGPLDSLVMVFNSLSDVAQITEFNSIADLKASPILTVEHLKITYDALNNGAIQYASTYFRQLSDYDLEVTFTFTPIPTFLLGVYRKDNFLGTLSFTFSGTLTVITKASDEIYKVCEMLKKVNSYPMLKGITK